MDKQNNKSLNQKYSKTDKRSLFLGGFIVFVITITPFLFYSYESFPSGTTWETSLFSLDTGYDSMQYFAYYFLGKFVPLLLLLIWFFTCKHWWHWIILVPIAMYAFQLWGVVNENYNMDVLEIYYILPLMMVLVPLVYLVRAKLFNKVRGTDLKAFEEDLMTKKSFWYQLRDLFR